MKLALGWGLLVVLIPAVVGCSNVKESQSKFDSIKVNMTLAEVEALLGKGEKLEGNWRFKAKVEDTTSLLLREPDEAGTDENYLWRIGASAIKIGFSNGKVWNKFYYKSATIEKIASSKSP